MVSTFLLYPLSQFYARMANSSLERQLTNFGWVSTASIACTSGSARCAPINFRLCMPRTRIQFVTCLQNPSPLFYCVACPLPEKSLLDAHVHPSSSTMQVLYIYVYNIV